MEVKSFRVHGTQNGLPQLYAVYMFLSMLSYYVKGVEILHDIFLPRLMNKLYFR